MSAPAGPGDRRWRVGLVAVPPGRPCTARQFTSRTSAHRAGACQCLEAGRCGLNVLIAPGERASTVTAAGTFTFSGLRQGPERERRARLTEMLGGCCVRRGRMQGGQRCCERPDRARKLASRALAAQTVPSDPSRSGV